GDNQADDQHHCAHPHGEERQRRRIGQAKLGADESGRPQHHEDRGCSKDGGIGQLWRWFRHCPRCLAELGRAVRFQMQSSPAPEAYDLAPQLRRNSEPNASPAGFLSGRKTKETDMSDPRSRDPQYDPPPIRDDEIRSQRLNELESSNAMWGWIAGAVVLA